MKYILLLVVCQFFWSSSYVAMKLALAEMPLGLVAILRYGIAALVVLAVASRKKWQLSWSHVVAFLIIGIFNFTSSPYFQLRALELTYATDTAVLVAFEPMLTVLLAVIILRERLHKSTMVTFFVATIGVLVMSELRGADGDLAISNRLLGNGFFMIAMCSEAVYSVACRRYHDAVDALQMVGLMMAAGALCNVLIFSGDMTVAHLQAISVTGWGAILFLALGTSAFGYVCWAWILGRLTVNQATLSLFLQPILGGIAAYIVLSEQPSLQTLLGAAIILGSLFIWLTGHLRRRGKQHGAQENAV